MQRAYLIIPRYMVDHLDEALVLAETAGYEILRVWKTRYPRRIGRGLLYEVSTNARTDNIETIIFYGELQPSNIFMLMKEAGVRVLDRVMLILEIFAKHAGSKEARLQIEMAKIKHEIPLVREFLRRSKMGEYPGFLGPGRYAIDSYYRHLTRKLAKIKRELEALRSERASRLYSRRRSGMIHAAIVGYASAGKTTLFNTLTGESKPTGPEYFTTLHPKHKAVSIDGVKVIFVDTVGFIRDVPPEVIEAFYSTLEEVALSDIILYIVDVSESKKEIREKLEAGLNTLTRIGAVGIPLIIAANKIDLVPRDELEDKLAIVEEVLRSHMGEARVIPVSAMKGLGLRKLLTSVREIGVDGRSRARVASSI
ncbi:MAG: GTPase HflX [Desulfurococcales archaeon]|nr:GTPase HflX [Desulfurococcales archaeon]